MTVWSYLLLLLPCLVSSAPNPGKLRSWRPKQNLNRQSKRHWSNETFTDSHSCAAPGAQAIDAPYQNVWGGLTSEETASVAAWLFSQSQFNLTATADAGDWDNSL